MACAAMSAACAVFVAMRAGKWRETDEAKALIKRVGEVETRVKACEIHMEDLPTRADIAKLQGELHAVREIGTRTERAVERIEGFMMRLEP